MSANKVQKSVENADGVLKKNEGWVKPAKHVLITYFYKNNIKSRENKNNNTNAHNIFTCNTEIDAEQEEDAVKIITKEK